MPSQISRHRFSRICLALLGALFLRALTAQAQESEAINTIEHYVPVISAAPSMSGEPALIYLRERVTDSTLSRRNFYGQVVLFVHGAGTPAEVAFDVPVQDYSWMAWLAERGYDAFSMDLTGYGRSTRPSVMNDRCNLGTEQQRQLFGNSCTASYPFAATTMASDWHDINAVVEYLLDLRNVRRVHLIGWSQGGPRTLGYAALYPGKVENVVVLAPAYSRELPVALSPEQYIGPALTKQSQSDFITGWERQVGCRNQFDPTVRAAVWRDMLASDPEGAKWGSGVRRAPRVPTFGWTRDVVMNMDTPVMMVVGTHDAQISPEQVMHLFEDLGSKQKMYLEMPCSSHNAMWERDARQLFDASYQWLEETRWNGMEIGVETLNSELE